LRRQFHTLAHVGETGPETIFRPAKLSTDRWVYVISGTLWVSDSDAKSSYPVKADNFVTNLAKTTFSDGNRAGATEPTVLIITGVGSPDNRIMSDYAQTTSVKVGDPAGAAPDASHTTITAVTKIRKKRKEETKSKHI